MIAKKETKKNAGKPQPPATPGKATPVAAKAEADKPGMDKGVKKETPFEKLFQDMLKDIYWCEQQLVPALMEMHGKATTPDLKSAFEDHMMITQKHITRLDQVFSSLGITAEAKKCDAMEGLISEGKRTAQETPEGSMTRDAGLIISAQKIEHYEISAYGSLVQVALTLGHRRAALILEKTLTEEEDTDLLLSDIAETEVNPMADNEGDNKSKENDKEKQPQPAKMDKSIAG